MSKYLFAVCAIKFIISEYISHCVQQSTGIDMYVKLIIAHFAHEEDKCMSGMIKCLREKKISKRLRENRISLNLIG